MSFTVIVLAQNKGITIDNNFVFKDGVYLSIEDLKKNEPIAPIHIDELISDLIDETDSDLKNRRKYKPKEDNYTGVLEVKKNVYTITWDELVSYNPVNLVWIDRVKVKLDGDNIQTVGIDNLYALCINGHLFIKFDRRSVAGSVIGTSKLINTCFLEVTSIGEILLLEDDLNVEDKGWQKSSNYYNQQLIKQSQTAFYIPRLKNKPLNINFYIVYIEDGMIAPLTDFNLIDIIFSDEDLYEKYMRDETQASKVLPYFVKKYNKNNPYTID